MFGRKEKSKSKTCVPTEIPGWTEPPYCILGSELREHGLAESWDDKLKDVEPLDVVRTLEGVPVKTGDDVSLGRRSWILASAYRQIHKKLEKEKLLNRKLEQQLLELDGKKLILECHQKLLQDKLDHYQRIAEKAAIRVAQVKYRKRKGKVNKGKVASALSVATVEWDPETWDGDIWDSTDSEDNDEYQVEELSPQAPIRAQPVNRRRRTTEYGPDHRPVRGRNGEMLPLLDEGGEQMIGPDGEPLVITEPVPRVREKAVMEDFTQAEVEDILQRFRQRNGESDLAWMVRLFDHGANGISLDATDIIRFLTLTKDPMVSKVFRHYFDGRGQEPANMLQIIASGMMEKYPTEADMPRNDKTWYTLRDGIEKVKEEAMRSSLGFVAEMGNYLDTRLTAGIRATILKTAPPAYKAVMMTLLLSLMDQPLSHLVDRMRELQDMGVWDKPDNEGKRSNETPRKSLPQNQGQSGQGGQGSQNRISRKEMFQALLKAGIKKEEIDGKDTQVLWRMYKQKVLSARKVDRDRKNDKKTPKEGREEGMPKWDDFKKLYPWEEIAAMVASKVQNVVPLTPPIGTEGEDSE
ncbi:Hypothetical predicted protein [Pelobates cultripes]|uniref:Uncharacterized protein n=1 Tax=Pelobates cultripes TaxID=61616 RepID=A0AAD1R558_PELCU|nr:Hypothetical predicted protein [Pelobates cultripes]